MILVDFNQIFLANIFSQQRSHVSLDEDLIRHTVISCTLSYHKNYHAKYGELVFCSDGEGNYWRKKIFPHYKANRKKSREKSGMDWAPVFSSLNKIREELKHNLPYRLINVDTCEADDIIAVLVKTHREKHLILSGDHDFIQLHSFGDVDQYSPIQKRFVKHNDPILYMKEKILRGDPGDGIPNFLSDDDSFVNPDKRQKPLREKVVNEYVNKVTEQFDESLKRNYNRNEKLMDLLTYVPKELEDKILTCYNEQSPTKRNMMKYFMNNGLKILMANISEF